MSCCVLANILMGTIYLFAEKFSYVFLNKAVYEKVIEMSTKRRQCGNNPDVFFYICGKYMMAKHQFNVRDFSQRACEAYFGMKLGDQDKSWAPTLYRNAVLLDSRKSQCNSVLGSYSMAGAQKSP